jgi:hypothetical protein
MTVRTLLASALLLGVTAVPAHAGGLVPTWSIDAVRDEITVYNDSCVWVHHHQTACVPKGYLPVDVMSYLPPPPTTP